MIRTCGWETPGESVVHDIILDTRGEGQKRVMLLSLT